MKLPESRSGKPLRQVMEQTARAAGALLKRRYGRPGAVREKKRNDFVSETDVAAEKLIGERLRDEYPDFAIVGEELGRAGRRGEYEWVVDPLDGTRNYLRGLPLFCTTFALVFRGRPAAGVAYDPLRDELYSAQAGSGAALNGERITVSAPGRLRDCVVGFDLGNAPERFAATYSLLAALMPDIQAVRVIGSMALGLAYAASGRIDLYYNLGASPWDIAAGIALCREAGAAVTDLAGREIGMPVDGIVAASPDAHRDFIRAIARRV